MSRFRSAADSSRDDFTTLATLLASIKGKFILSLNDTPGVREVFKGYNLEKVKTRYSVGPVRDQPVGELLITNFVRKQ